MDHENRNGRPGGAACVPGDDLNISRVSELTPILRHPRAVAPAYVVLVTTQQGRDRRRVYLSLHSALKAKERAEDAGHAVDLVLCELVPVSHRPALVVGGER